MNRTKKMILAAAIVAGVTSANAQNHVTKPMIAEPAKNLQQATPDKAWRVDKTGKRISPIFNAQTGNSGRNLGTWGVAFDMWNTNPTALPAFAAHGANFYGTNTPNFRFPNETRNYMWDNDCQVIAGGNAGGVAEYVAQGCVWNPNGTATRSGTKTLIVVMFPFNKNDRTGAGPADDDFMSGLAFQFTNLNAGFYLLTYDLSSGGPFPNLSLPIPLQNGGVRFYVATLDGSNNTVQLDTPNSSQAILKNMLSPGDTPAGTNPSDSDGDAWYDDSTYLNLGDIPWNGTTNDVSNNPDYRFNDLTQTAPEGAGAWAEWYNWANGANGDTQPSFSLFTNDESRTIKGTITFNNLAGPHPTYVDIDFDGDGTFDTTVAVAADGSYTAAETDQINGHNGVMRFKADHWLAKGVAVNTTAGSVTGVNATLTNGDVDTDNVVSVFDYIVMSDNFDKDSSAPDWNDPQGGTSGNPPIKFADLDRDDVVSIFDYIILSDNFDISGD